MTPDAQGRSEPKGTVADWARDRLHPLVGTGGVRVNGARLPESADAQYRPALHGIGAVVMRSLERGRHIELHTSDRGPALTAQTEQLLAVESPTAAGGAQ